jgi:hypothetical protein
MHRPLLAALLLGAALSLGCDGGGTVDVSSADGGPGPRRDAAGTGTGAGGAGGGTAPRPPVRDGGGSDRTGSMADRPSRTVTVSREAKQILPSGWALLGTHRTACSHGLVSEGASADRWCAVSRPGRMIGRRELWVLNITKGAGMNVMCDGSSPLCIQLTDDLFSGQPDVGPAYPTSHRFTGDVLVYYAKPESRSSDLYKGPVFVWKPGWTAGKQIASNKGVLCSGHGRADVAVCIENITDENVEPVEWDLHAGPIDGGPLPKVARITPLRAANNATQWRSGFTADGKWFAYSTGGRTTMPRDREALHVMRTEDIASADKRVTVGSGISRWTISPDTKRWFYLRNYNYNTEGEPRGDLYMANFPDGANETLLVGRVGAYSLLVDADDKERGIIYLDNVRASRGAFKILRDIAKFEDPNATVEIVKMIGSVPILSTDFKWGFYAREFDEDTGLSDAWIARLDDQPRVCALTMGLEASIFGAPFNRSAGLTFWADNIDLDTDSGEGWAASPDGCSNKRQFSNAVDFWFVYRDEGMVLSDDSDGDVVTLRVLKFANDGKQLASNRGMELQKTVDRIYSVLPSFEGTIFSISVSSDDKQNGLYYMKLPFEAAPAPADAGAPRDTVTAAPAPDTAAAAAADAQAPSPGSVDAVSGG